MCAWAREGSERDGQEPEHDGRGNASEGWERVGGTGQECNKRRRETYTRVAAFVPKTGISNVSVIHMHPLGLGVTYKQASPLEVACEHQGGPHQSG